MYFATSSPDILYSNQDHSLVERPITIVDVGVPRNVDHECRKNKWIELITIDELELVAKETQSNRKNEIPKINVILKEEKQVFLDWYFFKKNMG